MTHLRALAISGAVPRALPTSLRALRHPLTLGSIAMLLVNDHVLKALAPSPLTGKLSDLAGLFFFPFLLAALLSLLLDRRRVPPRRTAALAFGVTGVWFALVKTVPAANALMVDALTHLLGAPAQIVLDPTDLLALVVLVPAWGLWLRLERAPAPRRLRPADLLALGLAALATVATTVGPPPPRVMRLVTFGQDVYAGIARKHSFTSQYSKTLEVIYSDDEGQTWHSINDDSVPTQVALQIQQPVLSPVSVCDPGNPKVCYRIASAEQVEGTMDGGETWQTVWQVPWGRRRYMERVATRELDLGPYDLVLLSKNGTTTLVVALGNEGVLVRNPDGHWQRVAVRDTVPTPYAAASLSDLFPTLLYETHTFLVLTVTTWLVCCILGWQVIRSRVCCPPERSTWWMIAPALWAVPAFLAMLACLLPDILVHPYFAIPELPLIPAALVFVGPAFAWRRAASIAPRPWTTRLTAWVSLFAALGIFPLAWLPFPLWALGIIPVYEMALALSAFIGIAVLVCGVYAVRRLSRLAVTPETTTADSE